MSNEKPVELTEAERDSLIVFDTGIYACAAEGYCSGYDHSQPGHDHEDIYDAVARIKAAARREALLEAAPKCDCAGLLIETNSHEEHCAIYRDPERERDEAVAALRRVEALAASAPWVPLRTDRAEVTRHSRMVKADDITAALAEPERDEEGGR